MENLLLILSKLEKSNKILFLVIISITFLYTNILNALELKGNFIQGGLVLGKTSSDSNIYLDDKKIPKDSSGEFLMAFDRDFKSSAILKIFSSKNDKIFRNLKIKQREYEVQRITIKDKKKVTPPKSFYKRIQSEGVLIKKAKAIVIDKSYYKSGFIMPAKGIISGVYGSKRIFNGIPKRPHYGIDIANKTGTKIIAPCDGVVVLAHHDLFYSGGTIIISHGRGLSSSLLHLSEILVKEGDFIEKGQIIAKMGKTGRATGPHLDWRMELRGIRIDPQLLLK